MNKKVVIIGAGGHAKVIADIVRKSGDTVVGFLDDDAKKIGKDFFGAQVLGSSAEYERYTEDCLFFLGIGNNAIRKRLAKTMKCRWYTAIHPCSVISEGANVGEGTCVMAGAVLNADATVGAHTIINTAAVLEHDVKVGDYSHISPKGTVCGMTTIGNEVWLGAGSTVVQCLSVCDGVMLGAGATLLQSIEECGTYVGVPARKIL